MVRAMEAKTYTILANGDGSFSVQINDGERTTATFVHGFKSDFAAETWALNHKDAHDTLARA
jgi:hypothetical protein